MESNFIITLQGLGKLDIAALRKSVLLDEVEVEEQKMPAGAFGEPITTTVVILIATAAVIRGLTAFWITKNRGKRFKEKFTVILPDGTQVEHEIELHDMSEEKLNASIYQKLADIPQLKEIISLIPED